MEKKSVFKTLQFIFFSLMTLGLIFTGVLFTVLNTYKKTVKTYINGEFVGYFDSEQQFDEIYNDLVAEKKNIDENVKVYLQDEPEFEESYIRDGLMADQNLYTNLRAKINTEYDIYKVYVNGEEKMLFNVQDEANKYAENLKSEVSSLDIEIQSEKVRELENVTSIERADNILKDIVDRNKPVEKPQTTTYTYTYTAPTTTSNQVSAAVAAAANGESGVWPCTPRLVICHYMGYPGHTGTDITGSGCFGQDIYAYKSGLVVFAGWNSGGYGNLVKIDHGNGVTTYYAHCSQILVTAGQQVSMGETIAKIGSTGYSSGPHLHFEVRINGVPVNAYPYIQGK